MSVTEAINFFKDFNLSTTEEKLVKKVLKNATERLDFLA
jgi:excinuclease UvrABC ATPase subunit